ncbi:hypothetical protein N2152v2_003732 [Parachlorella kessleri]
MQAFRRFYENVVPSVPFPQLSPPQNLCLCRFTPCGRYLIAFNSARGELVLYRFRGLQLSVSGDGASVLPSPLPPTSTHIVRVKRPRSPTAAASAGGHPSARGAPRPQQHGTLASPATHGGGGVRFAAGLLASAGAAPHAASPVDRQARPAASQQPGQSHQGHTLAPGPPSQQQQQPRVSAETAPQPPQLRLQQQQQQQQQPLRPAPFQRPQQQRQLAVTGRLAHAGRGGRRSEREWGGSSSDTGPSAAGSGHQQQQLQFGDVFEPYACLQITTSGDEQVATDFALVAHGHLLIVASSSPEGALMDAEGVLPLAEATTLHVVDLASRKVVDRHVIGGDCVELSRHQGVHLYQDLLMVLGISSQTLYLLHVLPSGRLVPLHTLGQHCRDDDALVIADQRHAEQHAQQARQRQLQEQAAARVSTAAARDREAAAAQQQQQQLQADVAWGSILGGSGLRQQQQPGRDGLLAGASMLHEAQRPAGAASAPLPSPATAAAAAAVAGIAPAAAAPAVAAGAPGPALPAPNGRAQHLLAQQLLRHGQGAGGGGGGGEDDGGGASSDSESEHREAPGAAPPLIQGLKQRLLVYLFRQALAQCRPMDARRPTGTKDDGPSRPGSRGSSGGAGAGASALGDLRASVGAGPGMGVPPASVAGGLVDRRPLERFYYHFEAFLELVMWKAQFLDRHRLLIHWVSPELLVGPHPRHGSPHLSATSAGPTHPASAYHMVYDMRAARVEALHGANSQQLVEWYLKHVEEIHSGSCVTKWERYASPAVLSRHAREQQARDPQQFMRDLRQRLGEELPVACQQQQASPYLDRNLYHYDDRFISPSMKGHHPPHRAVKFMCCSQPERLRFKLEPQDITHHLPGGGRGGSRVHQVCYLFHPFQPFLLAVVQDMETGQPEGVTAFARLA